MKVKTGEHNSVPVDLTLNMVKFPGKQKHKVSRQIYICTSLDKSERTNDSQIKPAQTY